MTACVRLRVVYRQGDPCPFKESIMRLRDGAMTLSDYNMRKTHDIMDTANCDGDIMRRADGFLWLCAENADAGERNGRKLAKLAINDDTPIVRYDSTHSSESAKSLKPDVFMGHPNGNAPCVGRARHADRQQNLRRRDGPARPYERGARSGCRVPPLPRVRAAPSTGLRRRTIPWV